VTQQHVLNRNVHAITEEDVGLDTGRAWGRERVIRRSPRVPVIGHFAADRLEPAPVDDKIPNPQSPSSGSSNQRTGVDCSIFMSAPPHNGDTPSVFHASLEKHAAPRENNRSRDLMETWSKGA
jgi:hypothetical protein